MPVGVAELLRGLPGDVDLDVFLALGERGIEPGLLPVGESFLPGAEDVADPVERITSASAVPEGVLLDAAADLIDRGGAELDDVERVEHRDGIVELVVEGLLVAGERVQRRDLHPVAELLPALLQPVGVGLRAAPGHEVQQAGPHPPGRIARQVDHPGQFLRTPPAIGDGSGGHVVPEVLVDAERGDPVEAGLVRGARLEHRLDVSPDRAPRHPELAGDALHRRVLPPHLPHRPDHRSGRELGARRGDQSVLLGERLPRARLISAPEPALAPPDPHRSGAHRRIDQHERLPAPRLGDLPAPRAPDRPRRGLDVDQEHAVAAALDSHHVQPAEADEHIAAITVDSRRRARSGAPRSIGHGSRSPNGKEAWSLPILGASTRPTPSPRGPAHHPPPPKVRRAGHPRAEPAGDDDQRDRPPHPSRP